MSTTGRRPPSDIWATFCNAIGGEQKVNAILAEGRTQEEQETLMEEMLVQAGIEDALDKVKIRERMRWLQGMYIFCSIRLRFGFGFRFRFRILFEQILLLL